MPSLVVDTSVALPATPSPRGMTHRLWLLLAVSALAYRAEYLRLELDALNADAEREGVGEVHGAELLESLAAAAEQRFAAMREHLPDDAPQDWASLGSAVLFDEYERKVLQFEAICVRGPAPFDPGPAPALTRDPADDAIVYAALLADADFLISDDRDIVPDGESAGTSTASTVSWRSVSGLHPGTLPAGRSGLGSDRRDDAGHRVPPSGQRTQTASSLSPATPEVRVQAPGRISSSGCGSTLA